MTSEALQTEQVAGKPYQGSLLIDLQQPGKQVELRWLPVDALVPHPKNPRVGRPDKIDAIIESMRADGYRPEKPMLVRPFNGHGYQIIGGHSRHAAAQEAGIERVFCAIEDMDDDAAILRIAQDNINDPLPWYSICLYVFQNAVKDSKKGLSRTQLVMAATGKEGKAAEHDAKRAGDAGEVIAHLLEQSPNDGGLLDPDSNRRLHLCEIKQCSPEHWPMLAELLVEHEWSVKDCKAAVERVRNVQSVIPAWWPFPLDSDYPRVAIEPGHAKAVTTALKAMSAAYDRLPQKATIYTLKGTKETREINGRLHRRFEPVASETRPRDQFIHALRHSDNRLSAKVADAISKRIMEEIQQHGQGGEEWRPVLTDKEEAERKARLAEIARLNEREQFMPRLLQGDVVEKLKTLPDNWFDLVCIDPPYNMDKADWDSFGNGQAFAQWARPWLKECKRVLKDSGALYIFGINRMLSHLQGELDALGLHYRNWIIWDTIQGAGGGLWVNRHEAILYYSKTDKPYEDADSVKLERHEENVREYKGKEYAFKNPSNVWRFPCVDDKHPERTSHPTQKPVELIARIIQASSPREGHVLDCFMGSGTTGVACMQSRRHCTGIDQNADYLAIAQARFDATEIGQ